MKVTKTGDWAQARHLLQTMPYKLKTTVSIAFRQEAELLRKQIVQGLTKQAPGGKSFKELSVFTLAARRLKNFKGTKALIRRGDLRGAISVIVRGEEAFVGVPRKARDKDGNPVIDIAELNEFGSKPIVIPITPKMRRYLAVLFKEAGETAGSSGGKGGSGKGVVVTRIPARPFLKPVFEKFSIGAEQRLLQRIAHQLGLRGKVS
jgi:hypothetical protein